jgi:hypothetical protein
LRGRSGSEEKQPTPNNAYAKDRQNHFHHFFVLCPLSICTHWITTRKRQLVVERGGEYDVEQADIRSDRSVVHHRVVSWRNPIRVVLVLGNTTDGVVSVFEASMERSY